MTISRNGRSTLVTLVVAAVVAGGLWYGLRPDPPLVDAAVAGALAERVRPLIEAERSGSLPAGQRDVCGVRVAGTEPAVTTADRATTAYVWAHCATLGAEVRSESVLPIRVVLSPAVIVDAAEAWDYSDGRVTAMFPERLHDVMLAGTPPEDLEAAFQARLRAAGA